MKFRILILLAGFITGSLSVIAQQPKADEAFGEVREGFMDVLTSIETEPEAPESVKPAQSSFGDPPEDAESAAMFGVPFGEKGLDLALAKFVSMRFRVVGSVGVERLEPTSRPARLPAALGVWTSADRGETTQPARRRSKPEVDARTEP